VSKLSAVTIYYKDMCNHRPTLNNKYLHVVAVHGTNTTHSHNMAAAMLMKTAEPLHCSG